jgi:hypothetical protein
MYSAKIYPSTCVYTSSVPVYLLHICCTSSVCTSITLILRNSIMETRKNVSLPGLTGNDIKQRVK